MPKDFKSGKFSRRSKDYFDYTSEIGKDKGKPDKEKFNVDTLGLAEKAMRNLPKSSYAIKADPYEAVLPSSEPYRILARFNKKTGGSYAGLENLDGGNAKQYANSPASNMLAYADFIRTNARVNYRMLPLDLRVHPKTSNSDYAGLLLIDEMRKSIAETVSILQSTTFTQMAIYDYGIVTDMPMGSATTTNYTINGQTVGVYDDLTDVIYGSLIFYQLVLQAGLNMHAWHNSFRLKMGQMIRRSWNRETPLLNGLFGLFKKKSFLSFIDSLSLSFEGEYIDLDEHRQINMLTLAPSSRSDALTDPVKELIVHMNHPENFKFVILDRVNQTAVDFFSLADLTVSYKTGPTSTSTANYFDLIEMVTSLLSAEDTMKWARENQGASLSYDNDRYNQVKWKIDAISRAFTVFKTKIADIREVLDTMARTGTINWVKGYKPTIVKDTDAESVDNLIINDIYKIKTSNAAEVDFDADTKRWRTFTTWNMYDGIPEYDAYQGGAFLTLSLKKLNYSNDNDLIHQYLPIRFTKSVNASDDKFLCISRDGFEMSVDNSNEVIMSTDTVLCRLAPLASQQNLKIKIPRLDANYTNVTDGQGNPVAVDTAHKSCMYKTLTQEFGFAQVTLVNNTDVSLDPDLVAIYMIEIEDITNEAITYARYNAPFKGTASTIDILGFKQTKVG